MNVVSQNGMNVGDRSDMVSAPRPSDLFPNFDFVRLMAASAVLFSHAFLITQGDETREPFRAVLGPHNIAGVFGVHVFFIISGFLVARSLRATSGVPRYLWKRFLRIYPGLFCCALVVALLLGPLFSTVDLSDYLSGSSWRSYVGSTLLVPGSQWAIETVSFYDDVNLIGEIVNGSLWTIPQEILCYLLLGLLQLPGWAKPAPLVLIALLCSGLSAGGLGSSGGLLSNFIFVAPGFFLGAALSFHDHAPLPGGRLTLICLSGLLLSAFAHMLLWGFPIFGAFLLIRLCMSPYVRLPDVRAIGDITYGVYLYGWPMEQVARAIVGDASSPALVFLIALPLSYLCGYLSWHLVERPFLRLGKRKRSSGAGRRTGSHPARSMASTGGWAGTFQTPAMRAMAGKPIAN